MTRRLKRWLSILVLGALAFSHASLVLATCAMDRGELSQMMSVEPGGVHDCCDEAVPVPGGERLPMSGNGCLSHCISDLQASGVPVITIAPPLDVPLLILPRSEYRGLRTPVVAAPLPPTVPPRILLHSFLI